MQRANVFNKKDAEVAKDLPAFDTKNKRRMITVVSFCEVIEDLFEFIEEKKGLQEKGESCCRTTKNSSSRLSDVNRSRR